MPSPQIHIIFETSSILIYFVLLLSIYSAKADFIEKTSENYGPYRVWWKQHYPCRGPKLANLTTYTATMEKHSDSYKGFINITFLEPTRIEDVKNSVYTVKGNQKILLWNYVVNKPCQHYAMSMLFVNRLGAQNCLVKKGTYVSEMNFTEVTHNYLGTSFFYGEFIFKVLIVSKKGNILCLVFDSIFEKKQ